LITEAKERLARLTDGQRECLYLVGQYLSSKEIAKLLHISPHTVDQRLKRATAILNVRSRFGAARLYLQNLDADDAGVVLHQTYHDLVYQSPELPPAPLSEPSAHSSDTVYRADSGVTGLPDAGDKLQKVKEANVSGSGQFVTRNPFWSQLFGVNSHNKLSIKQRLAIMIALMFMFIFAFSALLSIAEGFSRLFITPLSKWHSFIKMFNVEITLVHFYLTFTYIYVIVRGLYLEKLTILFMVVGFDLTAILYITGPRSWLTPYWPMILVDVVTLLVLGVFALRSERFWPLPVAALAVIPVITPIITVFSDNVTSDAIGRTQGMSSYFQLAILVVASERSRLRASKN
jgi:DNA-binding CsgD family transcriptional regulator